MLLAECAKELGAHDFKFLKDIAESLKADGNTASAEQKQELLKLLDTLRSEVATLAKTNGEQADSIAGFAQLSAREATRAEPNPQLREISTQGLRSSVEGFEQSHPKLVQIVNSISNTLANWGI